MIRFRIGQGWKREAAPDARTPPEPLDAFGLEIDGVDLLSGANEEKLAQVIPAWVAGIAQLWVSGWNWVQLSLPEAHLEVIVERKAEDDAELSVYSLGRPARRLRPAVKLELGELKDAVLRCADDWLRQMPPRAHKKGLKQDSKALRTKSLATAARGWRETGYSFQLSTEADRGRRWELRLDDPEDLLLAYREPRRGGLWPLLQEGQLALYDGGHRVRTAGGPVFLQLLELLRQADALAEVGEGSEPQAPLSFAGATLSTETDLPALLRSLYRLGLSFSAACQNRNSKLKQNPYLRELQQRCREGLRRWKDPVSRTAVKPGTGSQKRSKRAQVTPPLAAGGDLRRLAFAPRWERQTASGLEGKGHLILGRSGPIFAGPETAAAFDREGELIFRRTAPLGLACSTEGAVLAAFENRILAYTGTGGSARWLRDHDGVPLGPRLERHGEVWLAELSGRGVAAFAIETGRELWRLVPPRSRHCQFSVLGERVLLGSDSGFLYGADLADGQVRFRIRSPLPLAGPAVPWGARFLATLGRSAETLLFAATSDNGNVIWSRELSLKYASSAVGISQKVYLAGLRDGEALLLSFDAKGKPKWERRLPLLTGPLQLLATPKGLLVADRAGASCLVSLGGEIQWVVGAPGQPLRRALPPRLARGVALLPGEQLRAVELATGRVLGEIDAGGGLLDLAVDPKLNLYLLEETGALRAYRLASHLAVVEH